MDKPMLSAHDARPDGISDLVGHAIHPSPRRSTGANMRPSLGGAKTAVDRILKAKAAKLT